MNVIVNAVLIVIALILFCGVVGERDRERHKYITLAFVATVAALALMHLTIGMGL